MNNILYLWRYKLSLKEDDEHTNNFVENDTIANTIEEAVAKIRKYQQEQHDRFDIIAIERILQLRPS